MFNKHCYITIIVLFIYVSKKNNKQQKNILMNADFFFYFHSVLILAERWWIGAVLDTVKNVWVWDRLGTAMTFTNWHPVEPNGEGREQCALMWDADLWQDYPCTDMFNIICERN